MTARIATDMDAARAEAGRLADVAGQGAFGHGRAAATVPLRPDLMSTAQLAIGPHTDILTSSALAAYAWSGLAERGVVVASVAATPTLANFGPFAKRSLDFSLAQHRMSSLPGTVWRQGSTPVLYSSSYVFVGFALQTGATLPVGSSYPAGSAATVLEVPGAIAVGVWNAGKLYAHVTMADGSTQIVGGFQLATNTVYAVEVELRAGVLALRVAGSEYLRMCPGVLPTASGSTSIAVGGGVGIPLLGQLHHLVILNAAPSRAELVGYRAWVVSECRTCALWLGVATPAATVDPPLIAPPEIVSAPVIAGVPSTAGTVLTCTMGSWTGSPTSYAIQWRRQGVNIAGATSSSLTSGTLDTGPDIDVVITPSNAGGAGIPAVSAPVRATIQSVLGTKLKHLRDSSGLVGSTSYSAWNDSTTTNMHFAQPTVGSQPTPRTIGGRNAVDYDGANDLMTSGASGKAWQDLSGGAGIGAVEFWVVCEPDAAPADNATPYLANAIFSIGSAWGELTFTLSGFRYILNDGVTNVPTPYVAASPGVRRMVNARHNGSQLVLVVDNTVSAPTACGPCGAGAQQLIEGTNFNDSARYDGGVAIVIAANGATVTATERADVYAILSFLFGVTTP